MASEESEFGHSRVATVNALAVINPLNVASVLSTGHQTLQTCPFLISISWKEDDRLEGHLSDGDL